MTDTVFAIYRQVFIDAWGLFNDYKDILYEDNEAWERLGAQANDLLTKYQGLEFATKSIYEVISAIEDHAKGKDKNCLQRILGGE